MALNALTKFAGTAALAAAAFAPVALSAQARGSWQASYHFLQLSISAQDMAVGEFQTKTKAITNCAEALSLGRDIGADIKRDRYVMPHQLPDDVKTALEDTKTGHATQVFSADGNVMRVLVICNKTN